MPEGSYTICVEVWDATGMIGRDCIDPEIMPLTPPELISPGDESVVIEPFPFFLWLPPMPFATSQSIVYQLKVVEQLDDQLPIEAMDANPAFFIRQNIQNTSFQLPVSARPFEVGKKYAWQVTAFKDIFKVGKSEVWNFVKIEGIEPQPPNAEMPDCDLYSVELKKTISGDSCYYKLSLVNNDSIAGVEFLPQSFTLSIKNDSIIAIDKKAVTSWEQKPALITDPLAKIKWKYKHGHIPEGKTNIGKIFLQGEPDNSFWAIYSWNNKKGKPICKDSIAFNETICYYNLSTQLPQAYIEIYDKNLNIRFANDYAPFKAFFLGICDAVTNELVGKLTTENLAESNPGFFVSHGLNKFSIDLENFPLQEDRIYQLTIVDARNYHYLKFKANYNHEEN